MARLPRNKKLPGPGPRTNPGAAGPKPDRDKGTQNNGNRGNRNGKDKDGKKGPNKGGPSGMPKYFGGLGGYKGVPTRKVNKLVNGLMRDELKSIRKERQMLRQESVNQRRIAKTDYRRGKGDLNHIFGETSDYLGFLNNQNQQMYAGQQAQSQAAQQALQAQLGGTYSGAADQVSSELSRLGIQGGGNLSQLYSDAANSQAMAAQSGANAQSTMAMSQGNAQTLSGLLQGMNQGQYLSSMGKLQNARSDALADVRQNRIDQQNQIRHAMRDVRASRRDLFNQMLNQLQETGWSQFMDLQQLKLARKNSNK